MFADRAKIYVRSGKGGDGHVSFRREKYVPSGGPDGGDGGHGGDVIFVVDEGLNTLIDFRHIRKYKAGDGEEGGKKNCRGKDGEDIIIKVPAGTVIKEAQSGQVITDMSGDNKRVVLLKGVHFLPQRKAPVRRYRLKTFPLNLYHGVYQARAYPAR